MLKDRFFEHIRDAFTLYHGAGKDSIDDFYYTLSTSAMLSGEAGFVKFPDVYDIYNILTGSCPTISEILPLITTLSLSDNI